MTHACTFMKMLVYINFFKFLHCSPNTCAATISAKCCNPILYRNSFSRLKLVSSLGYETEITLLQCNLYKIQGAGFHRVCIML